jgi:HEAT repeat protein
LLAVARDRGRSQGQRYCAVAALVPFSRDECGPEFDWLIPHLTELLDDPDREVQREAATVLRAFGERSAAAGPALVRLLGVEDDRMPYLVLGTLDRLGSEAARAALPFVRPLLGHRSVMVQGEARRFVARHAAPADQVREAREAIRSSDAARRRQAIPRLIALADQLPDFVDLLRQALADPSEAVRIAAASEMAGSRWPEGIDPGPLLREALDELLRLLKTGDPRTRARVVEVLASKPLRGPEARAATCAALADEEPVRAAAMRSLQHNWRPLPADAVPGLVHLVRTDPSYHGRDAAWLLLDFFPRPAELLPALRERLRLPEASRSAVEALDRLHHVPTEDELPLLAAMLDDNAFVSGPAARLLARMGAPGLPHLIDRLTTQNASLAARALATVGPLAREALPVLANLVQHDYSFVRDVVVETIAAIGTPAEIVSLLRPAFRDRRGNVRGRVLQVCTRLGADARPWLPELLHLLRTEDRPDELRPYQLASTLAGLAEQLPEVVGVVRQALGEPGTARGNAITTLAEMGPRAAEAAGDLEALRESADPREREALEQALVRIRGTTP